MARKKRKLLHKRKPKSLKYLNLPRYIIDDHLHQLSGSDWKVLTFIACSSDFKKTSNHFGRCWLTYDQITKATGVKSVARCVKALKIHKLIKVIHTKHSDGVSVKTSNQFTVNWFKKEKHLKKVSTPDNPKKEVKQIEDKYPSVTKAIRQGWIDNIVKNGRHDGEVKWELKKYHKHRKPKYFHTFTPRDENNFKKASEKLRAFEIKHTKEIRSYPYPPLIEFIFEILGESKKKRIHTGYLVQDFLYNNQLYNLLKERAYIS